MIKGLENITFKNSVIRNIEKEEEKECTECDAKKNCWYKEIELMCRQMRR